MNFTKRKQLRPRENTLIEAWGDGDWTVEVGEVMYGRRIQLRYLDSLCYVTDYCAGDDIDWQRAILLAVVMIMERYMLGRPGDVERLFQRIPQTVKPMYNDDDCWLALASLAALPGDYHLVAAIAEARGMLVGVPAMTFDLGRKIQGGR